LRLSAKNEDFIEMAQTLAEKILSAHTVSPVHAGEYAQVRIDVALANDITAPIAIEQFKSIGTDRVFDPEKIVLVPDHFAPNKDIRSATQCKIMRQFAYAQGITHYFEVGRMGIEHVLLPEQGLVTPGDVIVGADSHTCTYGALGAFATGVGSTDIAAAMATGEIWMRIPETIKVKYCGELLPWVGGKDLILYTIGKIGVSGALYKAIEFCGDTMDGLSVAGRFTMANMAIEAGAKAGLFPVDEKTRTYLNGRITREYEVFLSDPDAEYLETVNIDASTIEPQVAFPYLPENTHPISEVGDISVDQVVIGSCTNGRLEDLRIAAKILRGRTVDRNVRCIVLPGSQQVYLDALREGLIEDFIIAGAAVSTPTCGPCLGGHMGVLAAGEKAVSTTNRNFRGRMGHPESEVYLTGPAVAAASAIAGRIANPQEVL
jgi:3-isopropylmalate/(R)-2-methylmalate dehydratase large subunit